MIEYYLITTILASINLFVFIVKFEEKRIVYYFTLLGVLMTVSCGGYWDGGIELVELLQKRQQILGGGGFREPGRGYFGKEDLLYRRLFCESGCIRFGVYNL